MRDEFSFRSLKIKSDILEEKPEGNLDLRNNSSINTSANNCFNEKSVSKKDNVKSKIKEYFEKKNQLIKEDFDSFLSFIGLKDIWSIEEEQKILWESIVSKAKDKDNIDYDATLEGIFELFEYEDDLIDIKKEDVDIIEKNEENDSDLFNDLINNNENCIDEYLNSIQNNTRLIFGIKFVNDFFLKKYIINNNIINKNNMTNSIKTINTNKVNDNEIENGINNESNKTNKNIEEEIEVTQLTNKLNKKIFINIDDIWNEIKTKYRFIMINKEELNNYFNNLVKNNIFGSRKSITSCCVIIKNDKLQEYCLDKELLTYVNTMLKISITKEEKEKQLDKNEENGENIINEENEYDNEQIFEKLRQLDYAVSDIFEIISLDEDKEIKNLLKMFNSIYIIQQKKHLFKKLEEIIKENKINERWKLDETESQLNINQINDSNKNNNNKSKIIMVPNDENDYLKQQINNLKERNEYLLKENNELKKNFPQDKNEITLKNSKIKINKLNIPKSDTYQSSGNSNLNYKNYISSREQQHYRNKTVGDENSIFNMLNQKSNTNAPHCYTNRNPLISLNLNKLNKGNSNSNNNSNNNLLNETNNGKSNNAGNKTNSVDYNGEEFTNSKMDLFSINGNNNLREKFLLETTEFGNEPSTPTLTPRSKVFEDNSFCLGDEHNMRIESKISAILSSREYNNSKENNNDSNNKMINFNKKKKMSFGINTELYNNESDDNSNDLVGNKYRYDFKYLSLNKKINKLLLHNNENLNSYEIFSDQINYILNGEKKQKGVLLITSQCFYILDESPEMNCILRISHQLLSSLSISKNNFNHLLIHFNEGSFIIIEIFSRIHLLHYLKELYYEYNYKKININFCNSFVIKLKNNLVYTYELKNRKDIIMTPNFENAQKIGILHKYQENFFSAYFDEKIVVLTSIGLIVFDKTYFNKPQIIIPIIGSAIKSIVANDKKKLYCFKIKTINNEAFIFGSNNKKEINDWMKELNSYKDLYESRMNNIIDDFVITTK